MTKTTRDLRKAIITLLHCKNEVQAKKCAERIDTLITDIDIQFALYEAVLDGAAAPPKKRIKK